VRNIKETFEGKKRGWKTKFIGGLQKIEVKHIEEYLESRAAKEELPSSLLLDEMYVST